MAGLFRALGIGGSSAPTVVDSLMDDAIRETAKNWGDWTGWSIHPYALQSLPAYTGDAPLRVIECGSGYSTSVLHLWTRKRSVESRVTSYEHEEEQMKRIRGLLDADAMQHVVRSELSQLTESRFREMLKSPSTSTEYWKQWADPLPEDLYGTTRVSRVFYKSLADDPPVLKADETLLVILDGPHGNGRSIAFPLLWGCTPKESIWLIDDYNHYPFLDEMSRIFHLSDQQIGRKGDKRWTIVRAVPK